MRQHELPTDVAKIGLRVLRGSGRAEPELTAAIMAAGGVSGRSRPLTSEQMARMVADVTQAGDAARGEGVFRRKDLNCLKCHAVSGAGGQVGPDLASIGASAQIDYLVESLLLPNKAVKENYHALVVSTDEGRIYTGVKVRQTDRELILRDAEDREVTLPLESIDQQAAAGSLMPSGLADNLTRAELIDLVRFLSELGKIGPYAVSKDRLVRRWELLKPTDEGLFQLRRTSFLSATTDDPAFTWSAAYSRVAGDLPKSDLLSLNIRNRPTPVAFARCYLDVSTAGKIKLRLNSASGLNMWIDSEPREPAREITLNLPRGKHRVTLAVDLVHRDEPLRLELADIAGSAAQAQIVNGK